MHFIAAIIPLLAATVSACSPMYDAQYQNGYLPPAPCWQEFDTACRPFLRRETEVAVNSNFKTAVVFGVSGYCFDVIAEEQARALDGRKTYGWNETHGVLNRIPGTSTLVISNMTESAVARYLALTYMPGTN